MKNLRAISTCTVLLALVGGLVVSAGSFGNASEKDKEENLVYKLRTYTTHPGRLPNLHARFHDHTMKLFEKHGIKNIVYWTPVDKENTLVYVIAHKSREAAKESWKGFGSDPEWQKAKNKSIESGKIVAKVKSVYLNPTDYSPMK